MLATKKTQKTLNLLSFLKNTLPQKVFLGGVVFIEIELLHELGLVKLIYFRKFVHILVITIFFNVYYL